MKNVLRMLAVLLAMSLACPLAAQAEGEALPDMVVQSVTWIDAKDAPNTAFFQPYPIGVKVVVKNQGQAPAVFPAGSLIAALTSVNGPPIIINAPPGGISIPPGGTRTVEGRYLSTEYIVLGVHVVDVMVSPGTVRESNTGNNTMRTSFQLNPHPMVIDPQGTPDFIIQSVMLLNSANSPVAIFQQGDEVTIRVVVRNMGTGATGIEGGRPLLAFRSATLTGIGTLALPEHYVFDISNPHTFEKRFRTDKAAAGVHIIEVVVDPDKLISESNETNNTSSIRLSIKARPTLSAPSRP